MRKEEIFSLKKLCFLLTVLTVILVATGCGNKGEAISVVQEGSLSSYPGVPFGEALEEYMGDVEWEAIESEDAVYVNVSGTVLYLEQEADALIQFTVDVENGSFEYNAFEIDGVAQPDYVYIGFLEAVYE